MANAFHKDQGPAEGIHALHTWDVANAAARLALTVVAADVGKVAHQLSDNTFWLLTTSAPTWVDITAAGASPPVYGTEFQVASSLPITTMTSVTFQSKVSLPVVAVVGGQYRVGVSYGWNHDATTSDFEGLILVNAVQQGELHKQEPKDSAGADPTGTPQRHFTSRIFYLTLAAAAAPTIDLQFRTDAAGVSSSIWEAVVEFWRVT